MTDLSPQRHQTHSPLQGAGQRMQNGQAGAGQAGAADACAQPQGPGVGADVHGAGGQTGGDAVSLLQGPCPQSGGHFNRVQAATGAGCRLGKPAQGAAVRSAGQHKRIGEVRTGHSALGQSCALRGRLGLRRTMPVWIGSDTAPERSSGQFADANLVSIPQRCGS